jgi:hypothetical protein
VHPPVDIPPRKGIARRGAGRLSRGGGRVRPGEAMGKGYIARGQCLRRARSWNVITRTAKSGESIDHWQSVGRQPRTRPPWRDCVGGFKTAGNDAPPRSQHSGARW